MISLIETRFYFQLSALKIYLNLNNISTQSGKVIENLILYPGYVSSNGTTLPYLYQGKMVDLDKSFDSSSTGINKINAYNTNMIEMAETKQSLSGGRIMYIIPSVNISGLTVYCNYKPSAASAWGIKSAQDPSAGAYLGYTILTGYSYIIECWNLGDGSSAMKVYRYDSNGDCEDVSATIRTSLLLKYN